MVTPPLLRNPETIPTPPPFKVTPFAPAPVTVVGLVNSSGLALSVVIVAPPLVITHAEIDELVSKVVRSLDDLHHELRGEGRV